MHRNLRFQVKLKRSNLQFFVWKLRGRGCLSTFRGRGGHPSRSSPPHAAWNRKREKTGRQEEKTGKKEGTAADTACNLAGWLLPRKSEPRHALTTEKQLPQEKHEYEAFWLSLAQPDNLCQMKSVTHNSRTIGVWAAWIYIWQYPWKWGQKWDRYML